MYNDANETYNYFQKKLNPYFFTLIQSKQIGKFLVAQIKYPNCNEFEGNKILVFEDIDIEILNKQKCIDPHFSESKKFPHPIARFLPTAEGWGYALKFCEMVNIDFIECHLHSF